MTGLRALVAKAIQQLEEAMDHEGLRPAELLKVVGVCATVGAPAGGTDPERIIHQQAEAQVDKEGIARNSLTAMVEDLHTAAWRRRLGEVEAEIRQRYADAEQPVTTEDRPRRPSSGMVNVFMPILSRGRVAVLIHGPPPIVPVAVDHEENLIQCYVSLGLGR